MDTSYYFFYHRHDLRTSLDQSWPKADPVLSSYGPSSSLDFMAFLFWHRSPPLEHKLWKWKCFGGISVLFWRRYQRTDKSGAHVEEIDIFIWVYGACVLGCPSVLQCEIVLVKALVDVDAGAVNDQLRLESYLSSVKQQMRQWYLKSFCWINFSLAIIIIMFKHCYAVTNLLCCFWWNWNYIETP